MPEVPHPDESVEPGAALEGSEPGWEYTTSATARLLHGVRDSANAFVLLKSIAGHLCVILENCEVCPPHLII